MAIVDNGPSPEQGFPEQTQFVLGATGIVSRTFSLWFRRFLEYTLLAGVITFLFTLVQAVIVYMILGPSALSLVTGGYADILSVLLEIGSYATMGTVAVLLFLVIAILGFVFSAIASGSAMKLALDDYGNPGGGSVGTSFSFALARVARLIGIQLVIGGIMMIIVLPVILAMAPLLLMVPPNPEAVVGMLMVMMVVTLVAVIVAFYISVRLAPSLAVAVAEDHGVIDSMKRAYDLTSGNFWHVFGSQLLIGIVVAIIETLVSWLTFPLVFTVGPWATVISRLIVALFLSPINPIFSIVLYRDLAARAEQRAEQWW